MACCWQFEMGLKFKLYRTLKIVTWELVPRSTWPPTIFFFGALDKKKVPIPPRALRAHAERLAMAIFVQPCHCRDFHSSKYDHVTRG